VGGAKGLRTQEDLLEMEGVLAPRRPRLLKRLGLDRYFLYSVGAVLLLLALWEGIVRWKGIPPLYLPGPTSIAQVFYQMALEPPTSPEGLSYHLLWTLFRILGGFAIAALTGIGIGLLMGMSKAFEAISDFIIAALYPIPKIAFIPLLIIWLGSGESYKIAVSALAAFFPIVINTFVGVKQVDPGLIKTAIDLGANWRQVQRKVILPGAIPSIFAGLRLGMGVTIILVVASEMVASRNGMGQILFTAGQIMETEKVFVSLVVLGLVGVAITKAQARIDRWIAPWVEKMEE
jgi:NitT/TauT family transport system permease protein